LQQDLSIMLTKPSISLGIQFIYLAWLLIFFNFLILMTSLDFCARIVELYSFIVDCILH
jgi:hypothetical protein